MNAFELIDAIRDDALDSPGDGELIVQALMRAALAIVVRNGDCAATALRDAADEIEEYEERIVH